MSLRLKGEIGRLMKSEQNFTCTKLSKFIFNAYSWLQYVANSFLFFIIIIIME